MRGSQGCFWNVILIDVWVPKLHREHFWRACWVSDNQNKRRRARTAGREHCGTPPDDLAAPPGVDPLESGGAVSGGAVTEGGAARRLRRASLEPRAPNRAARRGKRRAGCTRRAACSHTGSRGSARSPTTTAATRASNAARSSRDDRSFAQVVGYHGRAWRPAQKWATRGWW